MDKMIMQNCKYVVFKLNDEFYAIDIMVVKTVEKLVIITRVPKVKDYISGIINLRGEIIPIIDLRKRFKMTINPTNDETRIIVLKVEENQIGLIVDLVDEVLEISSNDIENASIVNNSINVSWISGVAKIYERVITILNFDKIIKMEDF